MTTDGCTIIGSGWGVVKFNDDTELLGLFDGLAADGDCSVKFDATDVRPDKLGLSKLSNVMSYKNR